MSTLLHYFLGFLFNLLMVIIITRFIYYPLNPDKNKTFTFIAFSTIIFFVIGLLTSVELSVGVGFGLFGLFSLIRYRTDPLPVRDMTYLFIILAISIMNAIFLNESLYAKLMIANFAILAVTYILEKGFGFDYLLKKKIKYEKIDLIVPEKKEELMADLKERTGLEDIQKVDVGDINFLRDSAELVIYYKE